MGASLVINWYNLWVVALPFLVSASSAGVITVLLWRVSRKGTTHHRSACVGCIFEEALIRNGSCQEACAVNYIPGLPLLLFFFTTTLAIGSLFFPQILLSYVLPFEAGPNLFAFFYTIIAAGTVASSVLLAGYLVQERAGDRTMLLRVTALGTLAGIMASPFQPTVATLVPVGILALLVGLGIELKARRGNPLLGIRSLGVAMLPLFALSLIGFVRIFEIISLT